MFDMERQRKRTRRQRPFNETFDEGSMNQSAGERSSPSLLHTQTENTYNIALNASPYHPANSCQNDARRTNVSEASPILASAPHLLPTLDGYGHTASLGNQYQTQNSNMFGGAYNHGMNPWNYQSQARPGPVLFDPVTQFPSPNQFHPQGASTSTSSFMLPSSSSHVQNSTIVPNQYGNIFILPTDGELIQVSIKDSGPLVTAQLRLGSEYSYIQKSTVETLALSSYKIPESKQRVIPTPTGALTPRDYAEIRLNTLGYPITNLDLDVQITVDDSAEPPITLGKSFMLKAMEKMVSPKNDFGPVQHHPLVQGHPNHVQPVMSPAPLWLPSFTPFTPLRSYPAGPPNLIIPMWSRPGMVNTESTGFDSLSPSLQPSGLSGDVETISSATSPMDDAMTLDASFPWDNFQEVKLNQPAQTYADMLDTAEADATPRPHIALETHNEWDESI